MLLGVGAIGLGVGGFLAWAAHAEIAAATIAHARLVPDGRTKTIGHLDGGTLAALLVREGDRVAAGAPLARLDVTRAAARLRELDDHLFGLKVRLARLEAEAAGRGTFELDPALSATAAATPGRAAVVEAERAILRARAEQIAGERRVTESVLAQLASRRAGLSARLPAWRTALAEREAEAAALETLWAQKLTVIGRVAEARVALALARATLGETEAEIAETDERLAETARQADAAEAALRQETAESLQETQLALALAEQQRLAAADVVEKAEIRAPEAGVVANVRLVTPGAPLPPGQPLMDLVPEDAPLVAEGRVRPADIDTVRVGLAAEIRLSAFPATTTDPVPARVTFVAADARVDERTGETFFPVRATLDPAALAPLPDLTPGMAGDLFILGETRTALDYLLQPIRESFARAWRE